MGTRGLDPVARARYNVRVYGPNPLARGKRQVIRYQIPFLLVITVLASRVMARAQDLRFDSFSRGQREVSILIGYGQNHRFPEANKDLFSFQVIKARYGYFNSPKTEAAVDLSYQRANASPESFAVLGTISYRYYFFVKGNTSAGADLGFGIARLDNTISSLGTKTNFTEQLGLCFHHTIGPTSAITVEYKFSHTSNAGMKLPNIGVNASLISVGLSYYPRR